MEWKTAEYNVHNLDLASGFVTACVTWSIKNKEYMVYVNNRNITSGHYADLGAAKKAAEAYITGKLQECLA